MSTAPLEVIVPDWPAPARVRALITTRAGGVSTGPYAGPEGSGGMNVGRGSGDDRASVDENRMRLRALLPADPAWLKQVHGATVVDAAEAAAVPGGAEADAAITDRAQVVAAVMVADCMPVLLADAQGRCVAAVHAGWRGLAAGVIQRAVRALRERLGEPDAQVLAYLGPAIGPDHFEVGTDVLEAMSAGLNGAAAAFVRRADRVHGGPVCPWAQRLEAGKRGRHLWRRRVHGLRPDPLLQPPPRPGDRTPCGADLDRADRVV